MALNIIHQCKKRKLQRKLKSQTLLTCDANDEGSLTFNVPRLSDTDLVSEQMAPHTLGLVSWIRWSVVVKLGVGILVKQ